MLTVILGFSTALVYGFADFFGAIASRKISSIVVTAVSGIVGFFFLLAMIPFFGATFSRDAIIAGIARIDGRRIVVVGTQKGTDTESNIRRGFGMPHPEGYRKAMRAFELAERLHLPLLTLIDTPGAHPGPESEQHGIAEAIAGFNALQPGGAVPRPDLLIVARGGGTLAARLPDPALYAEFAGASERIAALYDASRAGVEIKLNIRGICCLKPGDPKHSKNIEVISVIDRYLEHARIFHFLQGGDSEVYIASADWMTRNLEKRVELMIPIAEPALKRRLIRILETYFNDETQASRILPNGSFTRVTKPTRGKGLRAQEHFYQQAKKAAKAREHERAMTFEPHRPAD